MNKEFTFFKDTVVDILEKIEREEQSIKKAADIIARSVIEDKLIHAIGTGGHSNMGAEEMFYRAGGLIPVNAILDPGINLTHGARRTTVIERTPGYGIKVMDAYNIGKTDNEVIIIINACGINTMTIDVALEAKKRGMKTIGITSTSFASTVPKNHPSRHPSNKNLHDLVDVFINNHQPIGDAVVELEGADQKVAPVSTICNSFAIQLLVIETVKKIIELGKKPLIWKSANMPGGDDANRKYFEEYSKRIKHLL
ncbi:MAG: SIS domain-containing protein [Actinobacteria bacterium]|nr:SIS domain-containing protein [Actinomycetota bacterium]